MDCTTRQEILQFFFEIPNTSDLATPLYGKQDTQLARRGYLDSFGEQIFRECTKGSEKRLLDDE